jgi:hypothetical protein
LDVQKHDVRPELARRRQRRFTVSGLADDVEALGFQQPPRDPTEALVVVHDQDGRHARIVAEPCLVRRTGSHTLAE